MLDAVDALTINPRSRTSTDDDAEPAMDARTPDWSLDRVSPRAAGASNSPVNGLPQPISINIDRAMHAMLYRESHELPRN